MYVKKCFKNTKIYVKFQLLYFKKIKITKNTDIIECCRNITMMYILILKICVQSVYIGVTIDDKLSSDAQRRIEHERG